MSDLALGPTNLPPPIVTFSPSDITQHQTATWGAVAVDRVQLIRQERFDCAFRGARHLLIASVRAEHDEGETLLEGLPKSQCHNYSKRLTFVPAGHQITGWHKPRGNMRSVHFYIDPNGPALDPELRFSEAAFKPQLFFFDRELWATVRKLGKQAASPDPNARTYNEALTVVLMHELLRVNGKAASASVVTRGGLAGWQRNRVTEYIQEHLSEDISLAQLALLAELSPYHFSRAFKQSFGQPPLRYHAHRRMELAKSLLAKPALSVTQIGQEVGFSETSAFTAAFRRFAGTTPTAFRRSAA